MIRLTYVVGTLLILLGIVGYLVAEEKSPTAFIPAAFGLIYIAMAVMGSKENLRKHAMHVTSIIALLGILGTGKGFLAFIQMPFGVDAARPLAVTSQGITFVLSLIYLVAAVRSFIAARRARNAAAE